MYNYLENEIQDVKEAIKENYTNEEIKEKLQDEETRQEWESELHGELWTNDSVTGNGSGSYTFNTYKAEENISHNWELIEETAEAFGDTPTIGTGYEHGAEFWDVSIRCYLLPQAITEALDELEEEIKGGE